MIYLLGFNMVKKSPTTPAGRRIQQLKKHLGLSYSEIAHSIGKKNGQSFYDILSGRHGISPSLASSIVEEWPEIRKEWLLLGEGDIVGECKNERPDTEEMWSEIKNLMAIIKSQQGTINTLSEIVGQLKDRINQTDII